MFDIFAGHRGRVVAGLLVGEFTAASQTLVVASIMPQIARDLDGLALYEFPYGALFVASLVSMPFAGPLADRYGTWRVLFAAYLCTLAGLLGSTFAPTMPAFIGARFVEGFGGGLDYAVSVAAVAKIFPESLRPRVFAWTSAMWVVPALIAPSLGAFITAILGWRAAFALFIPLVILAALLVVPALRQLAEVRSEADPLGAIRELFSADMFRLRERRHVAFVAFAVLQGAFFGADAYVTLGLTSVRGLSLALASVCITLGVLGWSAASAVQPALYRPLGSRALVILSACAGMIAVLGMFFVMRGAPIPLAYVTWFFGGCAMGIGYNTLTLESLAGIDPGDEGRISSAALLAGTCGSSIGVLLLGAPITIANAFGYPLASALQWTFGAAALATVVLAALALRLPPRYSS